MAEPVRGERVAAYDRLVAALPEVTRKGAMPYSR